MSQTPARVMLLATGQIALDPLLLALLLTLAFLGGVLVACRLLRW